MKQVSVRTRALDKLELFYYLILSYSQWTLSFHIKHIVSQTASPPPPRYIHTSIRIILSDFHREMMLKLDNSISNNILNAFEEMEKSSQRRERFEEITMQKGHVTDAMTMTKPTE